MKITKIKFLIFTLLLSVAVVTGVVLIKSGNNNKYQRQLDLGYQFLNDMNYEAAIAAFNGAIGIDPRAYEAFLGITQAYMEMEEYTSAVSYLTQVYELTQNPSIKASLDKIQSTTNNVEIKQELGNAIEQLKPGTITSPEASANENEEATPDSFVNNVIPENEIMPPQGGGNVGFNENMNSQNTPVRSFNYTASEFTFMGYPINGNHFYEWKSALGFPEYDYNPGLLSPNNGISAYMSYEDGSEYDTPSDDGSLTDWQALHLLDESETPIIDWVYRAGEGIPYYFLFGTTSGAEGWQASIATNVGTPIPLGSSFEEVLNILGCTQTPELNSEMVTINNQGQQPIAYIYYLSAGESWPSYGDTILSITPTMSGDEFNIYFRNNVVSAIDVWSQG